MTQSIVKSFFYATKGILHFLITERNGKLEILGAIGITILGWYFNINAIEWCIQTLCIAMVIGIEIINTAIEELSNYVSPNKHPKIGIIKDLSAGAVLFVSIVSSLIGFIIYLPKISTQFI